MLLQIQKIICGITYRGTDLKQIGRLLKDIKADIQEFLYSKSSQMEDAIKFFNKNKNKNNYLFGHSLGGSLAEHVLLNNYSNIQNITTINSISLEKHFFNAEEKQAYYNKNNSIVIGGDWVSTLKENEELDKNTTFVYNNNKLKRNIFSEHALEVASIDKNGNFNVGTKAQVYKNHEHKVQRKVILAIIKLGDFFKSNKRINKIKLLEAPKENKYIQNLKIENQPVISKERNNIKKESQIQKEDKEACK